MNLKDINDEKQDEEWDLFGGIDVVVAKLPRDHLVIGLKMEIIVKHFDRRHQWRREREGEGGWGVPGHDAACCREPGQSDSHYKLFKMDATRKIREKIIFITWHFSIPVFNFNTGSPTTLKDNIGVKTMRKRYICLSEELKFLEINNKYNDKKNGIGTRTWWQVPPQPPLLHEPG